MIDNRLQCLVLLAVVAASGFSLPSASARSVAADERDQSRAAATEDTVIVQSGDEARFDSAASVPIDQKLAAAKNVHLVELIGDEKKVVPSQIEPGNPPRLWWIVRGELPAKSKRTYRIASGAAADVATVKVDRRDDAITVQIGDAPVLQYNSAHVAPPESLDAKYGRSAFIHPCWTPKGAIVTDQFPPDHAHQSGLFLAYTKTEFEGRTPNFWDLLGGTGLVRFKEFQKSAAGLVFGEFSVVHEHVDQSAKEPKVALLETWRVRVWNGDGSDASHWICDIHSTIECATTSPLKLPAYHYGGMALRGARGWDAEHARIVTSEGQDRVAGNHARVRWCDLSGPVGEHEAGITLFTHPANFRSPEPLRIHPTMPYMVYTPSQLGDWEIAPGKKHESQYRFVFHDGEMPAATAERLWKNFAEPLDAKVAKKPRTK